MMTPTRSAEHTPTIMRRAGKESNGGAPRESQLSTGSSDGEHRISSLYGSGANFLISFLVDARGGVMENSRLKGLRLIMPPQAVPAPTRVTCKVVRRDSRCTPPGLQFSEGLGTRIVQFGPIGMKFSQPVCIEVPLCASTADSQREFIVQRSENGETWSEHAYEISDAKQMELFAALKQSAIESGTGPVDDVDFETEEQLRERSACRIFTADFPAYFAIVSRVRVDATYFDPEGGVLLSRTVNAAQAVFPDGALQKRIRIALQTHVVTRDWLTLLSLDGHINEVSPVLTIEPRRRKFHKPILLAMPMQRTYQAEEINAAQSDLQQLRLLCSIATESNGVAPTWEDITGSTQLKMVKNCVTFSTTVSAKYWLVDTANPAGAVSDANRLYQAAASVPYKARCYVFVKPHTVESDAENDADATSGKNASGEREYHFRVFIACEDVFSKSLEAHEHFVELARSDAFEIRHTTEYFVELTGNLVAVHAGGDEQVPFRFAALADNANRLAFVVRARDIRLRPNGSFSIARSPKPTLVQQSRNPDLFRPAVTLPLDLAAAFGWEAPPAAALLTPPISNYVAQNETANGELETPPAQEVNELMEALKSERHEVAKQVIRKPEFASLDDRAAAVNELANVLNDAFKVHDLLVDLHKHDDEYGECHSVSEDEIEACDKHKK